MSNDFSNLLRNVEALESIDDFSDEDQPLENLELFLALISSGKTSWRIRRMKRRRKQKGKQGRRKGQRATYTRRWITHDCLAWNYSISPPLARTTDYPPGLACSLRFHSIMHPASPTSHLLLLLPPLRSYYYFSARDLAPTTSFLAKPGVDDDDETRRAGNSIVPSLSVAKSGLTRLFLRKIRLRGETLTSLCVARGWKPHSWMKSDRIFLMIENLHRFSNPTVYGFSCIWWETVYGESRNSFEISNVWFYCDIVIFSSRLGNIKNITIHWKNNKEITIFVLLSLDSNRAG